MLERHHVCVRNLVDAIENVLLYGLKAAGHRGDESHGSKTNMYWPYVSSISSISSDAELVVQMIGQMSNTDVLAKGMFLEATEASGERFG